MDYLIKAPNQNFSGRTLGLKFEGGQAFLNRHTLPKLGRSISQLLRAFEDDFGYTVQKLQEESPREAGQAEVAQPEPIAGEGAMQRRRGGRPRKVAQDATATS